MIKEGFSLDACLEANRQMTEELVRAIVSGIVQTVKTSDIRMKTLHVDYFRTVHAVQRENIG